MKRRAEVNGLPNINAVPAFMFSEDPLVKARRLNIYFANGFERVFRRIPMPRDVTAEQSKAALNQLLADMFILKMGVFARQEQEKSVA